MTNEKKTPRFTINFIEKTITGTKASFDKAGKGTGLIYEELATKIAAHPDFELVVKEQKKHSNKVKETYRGLDEPFMKAFIGIQKTAEQDMKEYEAVKKSAEDAKRKVYPFVKTWFLGKYKGFNMKDAKKAITQAMIDGAIQTVKLAALETSQTDDAADVADAAAAA